MERNVRVAVILGSVRSGRFGPVVARWFLEQATRHEGVEATLVDLLETGHDWGSFSRAVDAADAIVVVTPEYNHSFPGPLKTAIDALHREWAGKPVGVVSYGGLSGGLRATEQLRLVFAELNAVTIRETISFHGARKAFDGAGQPLDRPGSEVAAGRFLASLVWWAQALHDARARQPYPV